MSFPASIFQAEEIRQGDTLPIWVTPPNDTQRGKRLFASDATQADISYKTLCIETRKKIKDLKEENYNKAIDLSYRSGQVHAYDYIIGNMKNVVGFSNTLRITDEGMNLSSDAP
ncbi:hypothetical protein CQW23_00648 [Capsicum baccatum]|uniref:Uncharacterized protein n=1 Tax=Capsicum baccatum TaxID=33114 RepID=A0A2G2XLB9_CAPBA|nr:hypothetical protein CQW23_00648 [Capsicum baccatum]